jgi:quinolinate synthase
MVESINATTPLAEALATLAKAYDLTFTKAVAAVTAPVRERLRPALSDADWARLAPLIVHINRIKKEKKAAILADFHQAPVVCAGVADKVGDDLALVRAAAGLRQPTILAATHLQLAETLKLAAPKKRVLVPDSRLTCPLATTVTREDVEAIRMQYPGAPVLAHVNATLGVKAVADAVITAANALEVLEAIPGERVIMVPDQFLAQNVARKTQRKIVTWAGRSEAFGAFTPERVAELRAAYPDAKVLAHPQNPPAVADAADFVGPLPAMADWIKLEKPERVVVLGEDNVTDNLAIGAPETTFVRVNGVDRLHRRLTLESVLWALHTMTEEIVLPPDLAAPARAPVTRMLAISGRA